MAGYIKGLTVKIGGDTTELGKALKEVEFKSKSLASELRDVEKLLKMDPGNMDLLAQKQDILKEAIAQTATKLDTLREAEQQVQEQFERGEVSRDAVLELQREIVRTESALKSYEKQAAKTAEEIESLGNEADDAAEDQKDLGNASTDAGKKAKKSAQSYADLTSEISGQEKELSDLKEKYTQVVVEQGKNSKEAKTLASEMKKLNSDLKDNKQKLSDAESAADKLADGLDDVGDSAKDGSDGFTVFGGALADLTADVIRSAVNAIGDLISALFELSEATEEYRSMQGKVAASAKNNGYSADFAAEKYENFYKYVGDDQQAANAITNLMGLQTSTDSLSGIIDGAIGAWASYGDSIPLESLTEAINETIQTGKVTGTFADTINWAKISNEEFSEALSGNSDAQAAFNKAIKDGENAEDAFSAALAATSDTQERADLVAQFLNQTYGESKSTYDEMTGSIQDANAAESELKATQAQLGEAIEPVNTAITNLKNQALQAILPVVQQLVDGFFDLLSWLKEHPAAMDAVTAVVAGLAAAFGVLATALAIQGIITGVTKAFALLNTTLLTNPIVLIVAAIAGLVAAFVVLWNKCDWFRNFWIDLWAKIKTAFAPVVAWLSSAAQSIATFFVNAWADIKSAWSAAVGWFSDIWSGICDVFSSVGSWLTEKFSSAWEGIKSAFSPFVGYFQQIWNTVKGIFSAVKSVLKGDFQGAWDAIKGVFSGWGSYFKGLWEQVKSAFSGALSGMASIGGDIVKGLWNGISNLTSWICEKIKGFCSNALGAIKDFFGIASPSRVMRDEVGKNIGLGMAEGITGSISAVEDAMGDLSTAAMQGMEDVTFDGGSLERNIQAQNARVVMDYTTTFDGSMLDKLDKILSAIEAGQVIALDGKTLVGGTASQYDRTLGQRRILITRGAV